jgi:hypothetical protein
MSGDGNSHGGHHSVLEAWPQRFLFCSEERKTQLAHGRYWRSAEMADLSVDISC